MLSTMPFMVSTPRAEAKARKAIRRGSAGSAPAAFELLRRALEQKVVQRPHPCELFGAELDRARSRHLTEQEGDAEIVESAGEGLDGFADDRPQRFAPVGRLLDRRLDRLRLRLVGGERQLEQQRILGVEIVVEPGLR